MTDYKNSRMTNIRGSLSSMYYVEQGKKLEDRFIRLEGQYNPENFSQANL